MVNASNLLREIIGTRTERLVDAIIADDIHTWDGLKEMTDFSEKELNYHLARLFSLEVLSKKGRLYYLIPEAVESYNNIDWKKAESVKIVRKDSTKSPKFDYQLPSINPKEAGARKKKLRGE